MSHKLSSEDIEFLKSFESCQINIKMFHHREHIRLAYIYILISRYNLDEARVRLKKSLMTFLASNGVEESHYHETMTCAWLLAVKHFMHRSKPVSSSKAFLKENKRLKDKDIMLTHYTQNLMNTDLARETFVKPNLDLIPTYE